MGLMVSAILMVPDDVGPNSPWLAASAETPVNSVNKATEAAQKRALCLINCVIMFTL